MPKVLLVEDDNNLREIFEMRLQAEGYETLTAGNGEEGLTIAMKEKPDLIIADVMMPKLSGFDMVESLRAAPELKQTKVIMMTALGQAEDQARGEKLGVVKYLVKSQATLEDFAKVVKDVMPPAGGSSPVAGTTSTQQADQNNNTKESENKMQDDQPSTMPASDPTAPAMDSSAPATNPVAGAPSEPATTGQMTTGEEKTEVQGQMDSFANAAEPTPADAPAPAEPATSSFAPAPAPADAPAPAADMSMPPTDASTPPAEPSAPAPAGDSSQTV